MRPCGSVRRPRPSRRTIAQPVTRDLMIYPTESNITLCRDGQVKVGSHVIGEWTKEEAYVGGFHYRPIYTGGKSSYSATIHGKNLVTASRKTDFVWKDCSIVQGWCRPFKVICDPGNNDLKTRNFLTLQESLSFLRSEDPRCFTSGAV